MASKNVAKPVRIGTPNRAVRKGSRFANRSEPDHVTGKGAQMNKPEKSEDYTAITEQLRKKIAAGEVDASVFIALAALEAVPVLKEIVGQLHEIADGTQAINSAIAPNIVGPTIHGGLSSIYSALERLSTQLINRR
jgi:hypothetical protein